MEAICDLDLRMCNLSFGHPGPMSDLNILEFISHIDDILAGIFPTVKVQCKWCGKQFNWFKYLMDGICQQWEICMSSKSMEKGKESQKYVRVR